MAIVPATPADADALVELLSAQLAEHDIALTPERTRAAVLGALERPQWGTFLVSRGPGGSLDGFAYLGDVWTLEHGGHSAWLEELYVRPQHRGTGLGTALLEAALETARARGCAAVDLDVEASHVRAEALYARTGFRRHARARWVRMLP